MAANLRNQARRESRRAALVEAAWSVFMAKGVAAASVDDIVGAAGTAKGTFYLYFATKDDAVNAVAERIVDQVAERVEAVATAPGRSPVERLVALGGSVGQVGADARERELIEVFHRPENKAIHDRLSERVASRLLGTVEGIIADGIALRLFVPQDPRIAAGLVLATFTALHELVEEGTDLGLVTSELSAFILRGLGYVGGDAR